MLPWGINQMVFLFCIVLLACISQYPAHALQCVVCESYTNGKICADWDRFSFIKDCSEDPNVDPTKPLACRRIDQIVDTDTTVIRQCSNVVHVDGCIDRVGTKGVRTRHCHCTTDLCNAAIPRGMTSSISVMLAALLPLGFAHLLRN